MRTVNFVNNNKYEKNLFIDKNQDFGKMKTKIHLPVQKH